MFLKRLDIVGFKSFADRVAVDFSGGVTAVVGPNGSGKSNITDAIRWVLGEQSAKSLRGAKMEDIIFAGSDTRKSVNMAEVTLTLDNEDHFLPIDYQEVSVTRRVFRSGESEFFINKQACRLKDIVDLFMDSGLGKEAFSIISQGKVEEILSSKAEDRRSIFEEAAGVLKYKTRKKKAEGKLLETEENLNRVEDILHELESQVEPLKIQASIAKEYLEQKEELEQIEVALIVHEIEELYEKWEKQSKMVEELKERELTVTTSVQKKEASIEQLRDQITALDESINDLQQVLLLASEELEKLEGRKEVLKERKKNATYNQSQLESMIKHISSTLEELSHQYEKHVNQLEKYEVVVKEVKSSLLEKEQAYLNLNENIEEEIETLKNEYFDLLNEQAQARNEIQYIEGQMKQHKMKMERLMTANEKFLEGRRTIEEQKHKLEAKLSFAQKELDEQVVAYREAQKQVELNKAAYEKKESSLYQAYQYLQQTRSRKEMLEAMQEDYTGFFQGVREVLKARNEIPGIHGAVAELIHMARNYETAIEIALGSALQHVVVNDEASARKAIAFLKQNKFGRATFLPLSVMNRRAISQADRMIVQNHPAFIGIASELVSFDEQYRPIIENLLGTVIVTKDLKGANDLAKQLRHRLRLVTLEGDVVNPGGSMTGGATKTKGNSLLSRKGELETIQEKLGEMERKTEALETDVKQLKATIQQQERFAEELREKGAELRLKEQSFRSEWREIELKEKNINDQLALYDTEKESFLQEESQYKDRIRILNNRLKTIDEAIKQLDGKIAELVSLKNTQQASKHELQEKITELKVELASKEEAYKNEKDTVERIRKEKEANEQKLYEAKEDLSILSNEMSNNVSGEEQLEEAAKRKLQDKNKTIELIHARREQRMKMQESLETEELELKELKRMQKQLIDSLKDEEVKVNRLDVELDNRLHRLREEYKLTYEAAKIEYPLHICAEEATKKVKLIKRSIDELGTVNIGAIDEYERISERYKFLCEQRNDLTEAKETLFNVISEMDEVMKKRFQSTFTQIRSEFETVFQVLFGGGRADLKLTDPTDLLNTGVDIVAQPPGKKLQNLGLLSGGERALTAIALLFSILKVRPVPFCVLDEVEAALDEANVQRFAKYLRRFSKETQFIVITHRKGTMEEADVLYGVTMQESGVSKLVSVKIEDSKQYMKSS
ncbi:chromosome segregation protein SMC [Bacillus sp. FJAT-47783]|uniref:chromosome segregation protein SMC n=1 Tax=Bacillus sp. FJAT-47783 TaxID=2922712 RepID=UPI001FAB86BE|nr:chromosome segregation protein SMC [Bacillus sp. FJAT-47783]